MAQNDVDQEFQAMTQPAMEFLNSINEKFPGRECVRDRSRLPADYDQIALSLYRMFLVRGDLRKDVREIFMRLATFQTLPADSRDAGMPLAIPPRTDEERRLNAAVVQARMAIWAKLDRIEAEHPATDEEKSRREMGFLITSEDRGWRPDAPTNVLHELNSCRAA
jgi:hypothetical protein